MRLRNLVVGALAICATLALAGCAGMSSSQATSTAAHYAVNGTVLAAEVNAVIPEVARAEGIIKSHWSSFSVTQQAELQQSKQSVNTAVSLVNGIANGSGGAAQVIVSLSQVQNVYDNARAGYSSAKKVVAARWSAFTPTQQAQLKQLDQRAKALNNAMTALLTAPNPRSAQVQAVLMTALQLAAAGAKIAVLAGA